MTGVEILATEEVAVAFGFNDVAFWITFAIIALFAFIYSVVAMIRYDVGFATVLFTILCMAAVLFGCLFGTGLAEPIEYETRYKVTISDEVPMNEFLERYEIIDRDGKIYIVREVKE